MSSALATCFDQAYRRVKPVFGSLPDSQLTRLVISERLGGRALDLGAGDGRNSMFLARHGFRVHAVELSHTGVMRLQEAATRENLAVSASRSDIRDSAAFVGPYDLIVADTVLCHLDQAGVRLLPQRIIAALAPGGWLYASVFAWDDWRESEFAPLVLSYFDRAGFCGLFSGLDSARCRQIRPLDRRHGRPHRHSLLQLVARKPAPLREPTCPS